MAEATPSQEPIPTYQIDLSLPPSERYFQLATDLGPKMKEITHLFDEVLAVAIPWVWLRRFVEWLSIFFLRRVYSAEETQELKGIAKASGVDLYFLVALNVLLDSLMGCTSGGVLTKPEKRNMVASSEDKGEPRMMHFRTLDWGMDEIRNVIVVLEFVKSKSETPPKVIARTITYAGFVGVLTGVRPNLSVSLNVRPTHSCSTLRLRLHQALVLFGFRPSIVSIMRNNFLPPGDTPKPLDEMTDTLVATRSSPCYLILSSAAKTSVIEKDFLVGKIRSASTFIAHTNHDIKTTNTVDPTPPQKEKSTILGMDAFLEESEERHHTIQKKWNSLVNRQERKRKENGEGKEGGTAATVVREKTLQGWVYTFPIMNECTHFGCIMDPASGTIRWIERGMLDEDSGDDNPNVSEM